MGACRRGRGRCCPPAAPSLCRAAALVVLVAAAAVFSRPAAAFEIPAQNSSNAPDALAVAPGELVLAVVIMRHGDRTPQRHAPAFAAGDRASIVGSHFPIDYTPWPVDFGQLTRLGMAQTRGIGRRLRHRYMIDEKGRSRGFLSQEYNHAETHVRSTDVDRTLVSAMNTMLGLYDENEEQERKADEDAGKRARGGSRGAKVHESRERSHKEALQDPVHVVVPVHTVEYKTDALMDGSAKIHCPRFHAAGELMLQTGFCRGAIMRNTELLAALPALTGQDTRGLEFEQLVALIAALRDLRVYQRAHNVSQPENVTRFDSALDDIVARIAIAKWDVTGLGVLVGGRLLRAIANRMLAVKDLIKGDATVHVRSREECNAKGSDSDEDGSCPRKLVLYVGHDTTIFDIRAALGLHPVVDGAHGGVAPYGSHVIFELRRRKVSRRRRSWLGGWASRWHYRKKHQHGHGQKSLRNKKDGSGSVEDDVVRNDSGAIDSEDGSDDSAAAPSASTAEYVVTVLHGSHRQPTIPAAGPFCGGRASCNMERFLKFVNSRLPPDVDEACGISKASSAETSEGAAEWLLGKPVLLGGSLLVAAVAGAAAGYLARGTVARRGDYLPIQE